MITAHEVEAALAGLEPGVRYSRESLALLAERANNELRAWGHTEHRVSLERVIPFYGDPSVLRWAFWCETCHVSQLALLSGPQADQAR